MDYLSNYNEWLKKTDSEELKAIAGDEKEIKERFALELAFGTAGMRGTIGLGTNKMNLFTVARATTGLANYIADINAKERGVVIAYDTRRMSSEFAIEASKVLAYYGIKVYLFENVRPVPIISFAVRHLKAIAGIMITASHNPKEYNGYKVYGEDGAQMSPAPTARVVSYIQQITDYFSLKKANLSINSLVDTKGKEGMTVGEFVTIIGSEVDNEYFKEIAKLSLSPDAVKSQASDLKIVYTPLHGAGYMPVTTILDRMGIPYNVVPEQAMPDPDFSTVSVPNPESRDALKLGIKLAKEIGATVVIGTDPDSDRMGVAIMDSNGEFSLLNGNQIGALLMDYILLRNKENATLPSNAAVIKTIVTTNFAKAIADSYGVTIYDVLTGFKFIGGKIKEWEQTGEHTFMFGYEESFGYLSGTHARDKDAVVSAMLFAEMVCYYKSKGKFVCDRLTELYTKFGFYKDISISITYSGLDGMEKMASIMEKLHSNQIWEIADKKVSYIADYDKEVIYHNDGAMDSTELPRTNAIYYGLVGGGWLCVRPSGTEPKLKIYVSICDETMQKAQDTADRLLCTMKDML